MRLDKYLAHAGIGTRKEVKQLIRKKHVTVNDIVVTKDDTHVQEGDRVALDDTLIAYEPFLYLMLNKPRDVICATQDREHETVLECIDAVLPKGCFPVGRLDIDTEGLVLITNDGKLAHRLLSPKHHVAKTYLVHMKKPLTSSDIETLCNGTIVLDDKAILPAKLTQLDETTCHLQICEGRYHQVKRMLQAVGNEVLYLKRITMGSLALDDGLQSGEWRALYEEEITALRKV